MSQEINTQLLERAKEIADYYTGTVVEDAIYNAIADNNLGRLMVLVQEAENEMFRSEFINDDPMTDERAEAMYTEAENARDARREDGMLGANDVF